MDVSQSAVAHAEVRNERDWLRPWEYALPAGELGVSACQTLIVALLPLLIRKEAGSSFGVGFAVGGEGLFALAVPWLAGRAVDRLPSKLARRFGRHSFLLLISTPVMIAALCVLPALTSYWFTTAIAFAFFVAQHAYQTPLMTLVVDALPDARRARVQGVRSIYRACGLSFGLVGGGLLFSIGHALPFVIGSGLLVLSTSATVWAEHHAASQQPSPQRPPRSSSLLRRLRENRPALWLLIANALWNGAIDGVRPYVFLFAMVVLNMSVPSTSLGMIALVVTLAAASAVFGKLGDGGDRLRLLEIGSLMVVAALTAGYFVRAPIPALVITVLAGAGAGALMTLPYALFAQHMGTQSTGEYSGFFVASVSAGRLAAPMFVGAAVDLGARVLPEQKGYPFMWPMAAALALAGSLALLRARRGGPQPSSAGSLGTTPV